jgi:hypothetical protein
MNNLIPESESSAKLCKFIGDTIGWYCDDPVTRKVWEELNKLRGVRNCNDLCKSEGHSGGSCKKVANYDTSTWCPKGQTCTCR